VTKMKREVMVQLSREDVKWLRFAADQLNDRQRQFADNRIGSQNLGQAKRTLRRIVKDWKAS
jgi:hypothetical protein